MSRREHSLSNKTFADPPVHHRANILLESHHEHKWDDPMDAAQQPTCPCLLPELLCHHVAPKLSTAALRAFRRVCRDARDAVATVGLTSIKRAPGTHALPADLGLRFPRLVSLDLSGDNQLDGGLALFRALHSASCLTSLNLAGCCALPGSFVARQLPEACPRLQRLSLSCCCSTPAESEASLLAALAAAPLATSLTCLELHCSAAFQPELIHLAGLAAGLKVLKIFGSRTLTDDTLAVLPRLAPALTVLHLGEQQTRRGAHIRGEGLAALTGLTGLRELSLACPQPDPRRMAAALANLSQLTALDLSRCEPQLVEAIAPLSALLLGTGSISRVEEEDEVGNSGNVHAVNEVTGLRLLSLPTAYTTHQLARGVPSALGGSGIASGLRDLRLHSSAALPAEVVRAVGWLGGLQALNLAHCRPPGHGAAAAAAALTGLTSLRLVQEYDGGTGGEREDDADGRGSSAVQGRDDEVTWYGSLSSWRLLRHLTLTDVDTLNDGHLYEMGCKLGALTYFSLSRNNLVTGSGFSSWQSGCRQLVSLALYDCPLMSDVALSYVSVLPLRSLALEHLPAIGEDGVRHLVATCTTLRNLTLEVMGGLSGRGLSSLWQLPLLEALRLRRCAVTNLCLEEALEGAERQRHELLTGTGGGVAKAHREEEIRQENLSAAESAALVSEQPSYNLPTQSVRETSAGLGASAARTGSAEGPKTSEPGQGVVPSGAAVVSGAVLTWLELQGSLVTTAGLRALRRAPGLTHLDLSACPGVGDGVVDLLLMGGGSSVVGEVNRAETGGAGSSDECAEIGGSIADAAVQAGVTHGRVVEEGRQNAIAGGAWFRPLLPCLVHVDLRGCLVGEATLERLRAAGLAVNTGAEVWR